MTAKPRAAPSSAACRARVDIVSSSLATGKRPGREQGCSPRQLRRRVGSQVQNASRSAHQLPIWGDAATPELCLSSSSSAAHSTRPIRPPWPLCAARRSRGLRAATAGTGRAISDGCRTSRRSTAEFWINAGGLPGGGPSARTRARHRNLPGLPGGPDLRGARRKH